MSVGLISGVFIVKFGHNLVMAYDIPWAVEKNMNSAIVG